MINSKKRYQENLGFYKNGTIKNDIAPNINLNLRCIVFIHIHLQSIARSKAV